MSDSVTNIVIAGLGGQGIITSSDILADAAFRQGYDVKKSELHGMSQRGGSVSSEVRFGSKVCSPMVTPGEADVLIVQAPDQVDNNRHMLKPGGVLITVDLVDEDRLSNKRSINVALLGVLSTHLPIDRSNWLAAIKAHLAERLHEANLEAFEVGRTVTV